MVKLTVLYTSTYDLAKEIFCMCEHFSPMVYSSKGQKTFIHSFAFHRSYISPVFSPSPVFMCCRTKLN